MEGIRHRARVETDQAQGVFFSNFVPSALRMSRLDIKLLSPIGELSYHDKNASTSRLSCHYSCLPA